jgi:2-keto-4-pentenoate hydratase/2-oxohepta-3-ene-1,7-dioic acid hydratase in catechol pathway
MIWCRFQSNNVISYGLVEGQAVVRVEGSPFGDHRRTADTYPLDAVKLLVPVIPGTFYCAGVNYRNHIIAMAKKRGQEPVFPPKADIGYRANSALIAQDEPIIKPRDAGAQFQYEGELVAVIGRTARNVSKVDALNYVFGWTIGNDVSERTWQRDDRTLWRAKNSDTFKPMGPWIVTGLHPKDMTTTIRLNGRETDRFATGDMIFDAATFISDVSRYITLHPGDVLWLGTDGLPQNMTPGDTVEIEISGIGVLRNPIVGEA